MLAASRKHVYWCCRPVAIPILFVCISLFGTSSSMVPPNTGLRAATARIHATHQTTESHIHDVMQLKQTRELMSRHCDCDNVGRALLVRGYSTKSGRFLSEVRAEADESLDRIVERLCDSTRTDSATADSRSFLEKADDREGADFLVAVGHTLFRRSQKLRDVFPVAETTYWATGISRRGEPVVTLGLVREVEMLETDSWSIHAEHCFWEEQVGEVGRDESVRFDGLHEESSSETQEEKSRVPVCCDREQFAIPTTSVLSVPADSVDLSHRLLRRETGLLEVQVEVRWALSGASVIRNSLGSINSVRLLLDATDTLGALFGQIDFEDVETVAALVGGKLHDHTASIGELLASYAAAGTGTDSGAATVGPDGGVAASPNRTAVLKLALLRTGDFVVDPRKDWTETFRSALKIFSQRYFQQGAVATRGLRAWGVAFPERLAWQQRERLPPFHATWDDSPNSSSDESLSLTHFQTVLTIVRQVFGDESLTREIGTMLFAIGAVMEEQRSCDRSVSHKNRTRTVSDASTSASSCRSASPVSPGPRRFAARNGAAPERLARLQSTTSNGDTVPLVDEEQGTPVASTDGTCTTTDTFLSDDGASNCVAKPAIRLEEDSKVVFEVALEQNRAFAGGLLCGVPKTGGGDVLRKWSLTLFAPGPGAADFPAEGQGLRGKNGQGEPVGLAYEVKETVFTPSTVNPINTTLRLAQQFSTGYRKVGLVCG